MVTVLKNSKMEIFTKESTKMEDFKEEEDTLGVMALYMKAFFKMVWEMGKAGGLLEVKMGINMRVNIVMILRMDMEFINGQMDRNMKVIFSKTKNMEMVFLPTKMEKYLNLHGKTEWWLQINSLPNINSIQ